MTQTKETFRLVITFENVTFSYSRNVSLIRNMNMNVPHGKIYALLGPNGCGKSTSLNLILGLLRPQQGNVKVFGLVPNRPDSPVPGVGSGYMPQDLTLIMKLTVMDHFFYYGRLTGMEDLQIRQRAGELVQILEIPSLERQIQALSGGQQRRTSLAVALLHSPPLLILDEPTVGIDPVLRDKVWKYLRQLCIQESKTIILTTHYIEESGQADTIGLMRNGKLLAESNPMKLLENFQMSKIEDVFLQLCEKQDSTDNNSNSNDNDNFVPCLMNQNFFPYEQPNRRFHFHFDFGRFWAIFADVAKFSTTTWLTIMLTTILPMAQLILFHYAIGLPPKTLPIVMTGVEKSHHQLSQFIIENLDPLINVTRIRSDNLTNDIDAGIRFIERRQAYAMLEIPENFTRCLTRRAMQGVMATNHTIECSQVRAYTDQTEQFIVFQLWLLLWEAYGNAVKRFFPDYGIHPDVLNVPIDLKPPVYGKFGIFFQEFMTPGIQMAITFLAPMIITVFVFFEQKCLRHILRSQACGAKTLEVLLAHFLFNSLLAIPQCILMLFASFYLLKAPIHGSLVLVSILIFMVAISAISIALLIGSIVHDKLTIFSSVYALITVFWLWCGTIWPKENNISWVMRKIALVLPLTLPVESARNIMNRGWNIDHPLVFAGFISITFHIVVPFILALLLFRH